MKETPPVRRAKSSLETSKKPNKVSKKSLLTDFAEASQDLSPISDHVESDKTTTDSVCTLDSPLAALSIFEPDSTLTTAGAKAFINSFDPVDKSLSLSVSESDLSPSSTVTTCVSKEDGPVESDLVVKELKEAMAQVLKSRDVDSRSKKILDAVIDTVIEDLPGVGISDVGWFDKLASKKAAVVLLNLLGVTTAILFFISAHQQAPFGPTPT